MKPVTPTLREEAMGYVLSFGLAAILFVSSVGAWWQLSLLSASSTVAHLGIESSMRYVGAAMSLVACSVWAYCYAVFVRSRHWLAVARASWHFLIPALILLISTGLATWLIYQRG